MNTTTTNSPRTGQDAHTPTPWAIGNHKPDGATINGCDGWIVAKTYGDTQAEQAANTAFIVRAVNSHAALVAALEEAQANLHSYQAYAEAMREHGRGHVPLTGKRGFGPEGLNSFIAAALAAARNP